MTHMYVCMYIELWVVYKGKNRSNIYIRFVKIYILYAPTKRPSDPPILPSLTTYTNKRIYTLITHNIKSVKKESKNKYPTEYAIYIISTYLFKGSSKQTTKNNHIFWRNKRYYMDILCVCVSLMFIYII